MILINEFIAAGLVGAIMGFIGGIFFMGVILLRKK